MSGIYLQQSSRTEFVS